MPKEKAPRITYQGLKVLTGLFNAGGASLSGADLMRVTGLASGSIYPLLFRFERAGWLRAEWEKIDASEAGRPRRRLYELTAVGRRAFLSARAELDFRADVVIGGGVVKDLLLAILARLLANEIERHLPTLHRALLDLAVALLPPDERASRREEWQAVLADSPAGLIRTIRAADFIRAAAVWRGVLGASSMRSWIETVVRLGVSADELQEIRKRDFELVIAAIKCGDLEVKEYAETRSIRNGEPLITGKLVVSCDIDRYLDGPLKGYSTAFQRGEWWRRAFWRGPRSDRRWF